MFSSSSPLRTRSWLKHIATAALLMSFSLNNAHAQFVKTQGQQLLDKDGEPLFLSGINLGNWLLWEGYLMMGDFEYRTHTQFLGSLEEAFGSREKALEFEHQWRLNYVDERAIADLAALGFNSVRVPFNYKLFWQDGKPSDKGFTYIDNLIAWCKTHDISILLDMHGAPGYQNPGDHSDNGDSNASQPRDTVKFWDGDNVAITSQIWAHIAKRYANEPTIWGYDLINEPVPQDGREYELLPSFIEITRAIRAVDKNHVIVAEGSWWGSDLDKIDWTLPETQAQTGISAAWDDNLVYQVHHYGPANVVFDKDESTKRMNIPLIIGEYGESENTNLQQITDWAKRDTVGYYPWSFKKMSHDKTLWTIPPNDLYEQFKNFVNNGGTPPANLYEGMIEFAQTAIKNGHPSHAWHNGFYEAVKPDNGQALPGTTCEGATAFDLPTTLEAEDFCAMNGVEKEKTADQSGGENIGYIDAQDWVEYKINTTEAQSFEFDFRVASATMTGAFDILSNDQIVGKMTVPNTGGWQTWSTISTRVDLPAGDQTLKLAFTGPGFNLNWIQVSQAGEAPSSSSSSVASSFAPASSTPVSSVASSSAPASSVSSISVSSSSDASSSAASTPEASSAGSSSSEAPPFNIAGSANPWWLAALMLVGGLLKSARLFKRA